MPQSRQLANRSRGYIDGDVRDEIEVKAETSDWSPAQIRRGLERQKGFEGRLPSAKTFETIVKRIRGAGDSTAPWHLSDGNEGALILPVLAEVIANTMGERRHLTEAEAGWICRVRRAAPDLSPLFAAYQLARVYLSRNARDVPTADLDAFLAFAPWRSEELAQRYYNAVYEGWTGPPLHFLDKIVSSDFHVEHRVMVDDSFGSGELPANTPSPRSLMESFDEAKRKTLSANKTRKVTRGK